MSTPLIIGLLMLCGWLALRLSGANRDIRELHARVESLKRQIVRMR